MHAMHPLVREQAEIYYGHHFGCAACKRAGLSTRGKRCSEGEELWGRYRKYSARASVKRSPRRSYYRPAEFEGREFHEVF